MYTILVSLTDEQSSVSFIFRYVSLGHPIVTRITRIEHRYRIYDRQAIFTCNTIRHIIVYLMNFFRKLDTRELRNKFHQNSFLL